MARLPAFCPACGTLYPAPLRSAGPRDVTGLDIPVPCPACGESGHILPEIYRRVARILELLLEERQDDGEARGTLRRLAEDAREDPPDPDDLRRDLHDAAGPYRDLSALLPADPGDLPPFMALLLAALEETEGADPGALPVDDPLVSRTIRRAVEEHGHRGDAVDGRERSARQRRPVGRNDPCPCGSGKKYKDCHWLEDRREQRS